jgi:hypothetical protein
MPNKSDNKIIIGFILTLLTGLIGYGTQHYFSLQEKRAELLDEVRVKAYIEFIDSANKTEEEKDPARFRLGLLGGPDVISSAGKYQKSLTLESEAKDRHSNAIALFHAMRKDINPQMANLTPDQSLYLEWLMTPKYKCEELQNGSQAK